MKVVGCYNGSPNNRTGGGYGIRLTHEDRDRYFRRAWHFVTIELEEGNIIEVNLSKSFWRCCPELRKAEIGKWMLEHRLVPWQKGDPPKMEMVHIRGNRFKVESR